VVGSGRLLLQPSGPKGVTHVPLAGLHRFMVLVTDVLHTPVHSLIYQSLPAEASLPAVTADCQGFREGDHLVFTPSG
jgi:hypothetical protein